jgi:poly-gamma-glutamate capsule biosynthesis protein CapA/YwtB (metallophosphatase superfamily)
MDPATLAAIVTGFIAPYLAKAGQTLMDGAVAKLPDATAKLWDAISDRFKGNPAAAGAANDLAENTADPDNQEAFKLQLKKALKEDEEFAKVLLVLVKEVKEAKQGDITNAGGVVATGEGIGVGKIEIGGNVSGSAIVTGSENQVRNG